ncbi:hypothetical protein AWENTII_002596 [Aspergillus wentii]
MASSSCLGDFQENTVHHISDEETLFDILAKPIATPPASDWSDLSIHDGAGSDEGDTFKYECTECRIVCANIAELCSHLLKENSAHVVCPDCLKEFYGSREEKEEKKKAHLIEHEEQKRRNFHDDSQGQNDHLQNKFSSSTTPAGVLYETKSDEQDDAKATALMSDKLTSGHENGSISTTQDEELYTEGNRSPRDDKDHAVSEGTYDADNSRSSSDESDENTEHSTGVTASQPGTNTTNRQQSTRSKSLTCFPYYYWEPDTFYAQLSNLNVERLKRERKQEMMWLRGFEGA